jgi:Spx/MgsR family transcriptional regulator
MPEVAAEASGPQLVVYGIKQCDTCRKALKWLDQRGLAWRFHDLRADGVPKAAIRGWLKTPFAPALVNKRSTTWRRLDEADRGRAETDALALLTAHPTLIKRPVFVANGELLAVGFSPAVLEDVL